LWHYFDPVTRAAPRPHGHAPAIRALGLLAALGLAPGCFPGRSPGLVGAPDVAVALPEPAPSEPPPAPGARHVVQRGQTLWRIARAYGVALEELARANGIQDPARLETGQVLVVPGAAHAIEVAPYRAAPAAAGAAMPASIAPALADALLWPVEGGRILSPFGAPRRGRSHRGADIAGAAGQPVRAAEAGRVVFSSDTRGGYGKTVILEHDDRLRSLYAHNADLLVREGEWVERGQTIARVGRTGNASTEHCHFEIRQDTTAIDPLPLLAGPGADEP